MNYLSAGNVACDILAKVSPRQKKSKRRLLLKDIGFFPGGDALNSAVDVSMMGENAMLIGCVGQDIFGRQIMETLSSYPVDLRYMRYEAGIQTSVSYYVVGENGERWPGETGGSCYRPGGNETLKAEDIPDEALRWADHLHLGSPMIQDGLDYEGNARLLKRARDMGITTSMDLVYDQDEVWLPKIEAALSYCDIFIPSDYEVECVCGLSDPQDIKEFFRPYGLKIFGMKLGAKGVFLTDFHRDIVVPSAYPGTPVDTLGAGDAFFAAFNVSYFKGFGLTRCAEIASYASACVLAHYGANTGMVSFDELKERG